MSNNPQLERYLSSLEKVLAPFPVSDRAEIITEIKSHILSALERDPAAQMDTILSAMGEPETVANRYLMERGIKPSRPSISPIVKWLVIGFLGMFAMSLLFAMVVFTKFSPLIKVDGKNDHVSLLGGLIDLDGKKDHFKLGRILGGENERTIEGSASVDPKNTFFVNFGNGKLEVLNAKNSELLWTCTVREDDHTDIFPSTTTEGTHLDLTGFKGIGCSIYVPKVSSIHIKGGNGKIEIDQPNSGVKVELTNGKVDFTPNKDKDYKYDVSLDIGKIDRFVSSNKPGAIPVSIHLVNGKISLED